MRKIVFFLIICSLGALCLAQTPAQAPAPVDPNQVVARVNGDPIYATQVQMAAQQIGQAMVRNGQEVDGARIGAAAMGQIVDGVLLVQEARRREMKADPAEIEATMARALQQYGGEEAFQTALQAQGLTKERFEQMVHDSMLVNQLVEELSKDIAISDEQIQTFYEENQELIKQPEQVHARHILFSLESDASEEDKKAALEKAEAAHKRAVEGEDFAELAKELSEGPSASKGGDLGFFSRERMVKPFSDAAFALEVGGISEPVLSQFGYHVILVEERKDAQVPALEEIKDRIEMGLTRQAQDGVVEELLSSLRDSADIVPLTPEGKPAPAATDAGDAEGASSNTP